VLTEAARMPMTSAADILRFWFGDKVADAANDPACAARWWSKQDAVDREIAERFGDVAALAADGSLEGWGATAEGRLALIVLTDQFPRNMHRGTPAAFAQDHLARRWSLEGIALGQFATLWPIQRVFAYLPLEHAEDLALQDRSVALFEALVVGSCPVERKPFEGFADYARRHRDVIQRFGRFPHRNAILGRDSRAEEVAFLRTPGSSF
jgi:uncharacterized protein (DUF924 family)